MNRITFHTLTFFLIFISGRLSLYAQDIDQQTIHLPALEVKGKEVIGLIEKNYPIQFTYGKEADDKLGKKIVFATLTNTVRQVLDLLQRSAGLSYRMAGKGVIILKAENPGGTNRPNGSTPSNPSRGSLTGKITDQDGLPLSAAGVYLEGTGLGTTTDDLGNFLFKAGSGNYVLIASFTGYAVYRKSITVISGKTIVEQIKLQKATNLLYEANVSGVRRKSATATRTLLQIQDIPQSIVVMGQKVIKEQGAFDLTTITRNISGLNYTGNYSGAGSYQFFNARGFDMSNSQNYRWNGQMIWNLGNNYGDNIEQVEFLKGPTSILFGDVSPGGVLNFVTKKPLANFMANVDFKTGQWGLVRPALDITGPINASKTLRYRLNTSYEQSNSFRDHVSYKRFLIAPTIAWDITPKLALNVEAVFRHSSSTDDAGLVSPDGTVEGLSRLSPHLYLGEPSHKYLYSDQGYFSTLTWQISKNWRIRNVNYYGHTTNRPFGIWPGSPDSAGNAPRSEYGYYQKLNNISSSLDAFGVFYTGPVKHNLLVGVEFQSTHYRYTTAGSLSPYDTINIYHPVYGAFPVITPATQYLPFESLIERTGFYLQDQLMFFKEKLHVLAGIRSGRTKQGNHYYQDQLPGTAYEGYKDDIVSKNVFTPRLGVVYKPQKWVSLYASWSKGYEINSPDVFALNYAQYSNPPATLSTQYEIGAKASLLQNRLGVSFTLFRIDKKNPYGYVYVPDSAGNIQYDKYNVYYDGHHRSQGIELDIDGKLSNTLSLTAGAAYTDAKIIMDPGYPSGNLLPNAPKFTGNAWLNYDGEGKLKGLSLGAGFFYKGKFFSSVTNDPGLVIPSNYTIDVSAGYTYRQWGAQVNVSNLTNRVSYLSPWVYILYDVQPLRRAVLTLTYRFEKNKAK